MRRRAILLASGAGVVLAAAESFAQVPIAPRRIAFVHPAREARFQAQFNAFRSGLRDLGYAEGRDVSIEATWANDETGRLPQLAVEVVARKPAVIVTGTSAAVAAFKRATSSIPIVFATAFDPVEQGFVSSLQRPGGNITGLLIYTKLEQKLMEVAREALPAARRLALLLYVTDPAHKYALEGFEETAHRLKFEPMLVKFSRREELDRVFADLVKGKADAVIIPQLSFFASNRKEVVDLGLKTRLPLLSAQLYVAEDGGLLSYGTAREEAWRRSAALVDKILHGANPGDLPIEQPERFELVVNLKTAKAIGVTLPQTTLLRANKVIR